MHRRKRNTSCLTLCVPAQTTTEHHPTCVVIFVPQQIISFADESAHLIHELENWQQVGAQNRDGFATMLMP